MVLKREYYDEEETEYQLHKAWYHIEKDIVDSEEEALEFVWDNDYVVEDFGVIQRIAAKVTEREDSYNVQILFSAPFIDGGATNAEKYKSLKKTDRILDRVRSFFA